MRFSLDFEAALFDIDGTLIDSNGAHAHAWTEALHEHDVAVELDSVRRLIGMGGDKLLPAIANIREESKEGKAIARRKKAIFQTLLPGLAATRGAKELVQYLRERGIELVIATSADENELAALLAQAGLADFFPKRTSKDDAAESKPDPDIVEAAIRKTSARPERIVMIGDTPYDIEAATRAGIGAIAVRCGGYWPDRDLAAARAICDDPRALLDALRSPLARDACRQALIHRPRHDVQ